MQSRLRAMQRLVTLYSAVEEMHSAELQRMTSAIREAQSAIGLEQEAVRSARRDGRGALVTGDLVSWRMAETQQEAAASRQQGLEQLRLEREELSESFREQYVASRLKKD